MSWRPREARKKKDAAHHAARPDNRHARAQHATRLLSAAAALRRVAAAAWASPPARAAMMTCRASSRRPRRSRADASSRCPRSSRTRPSLMRTCNLRSPFMPSSAESGRATPDLRPDAHRNREFLEQYSLDTMKMVGTMQLGGQMFGLVQTKDGLVHRVVDRQLHGPGRRQDHRHHPIKDQSRRNRSGRPGWLHRAPRGARV